MLVPLFEHRSTLLFDQILQNSVNLLSTNLLENYWHINSKILVKLGIVFDEQQLLQQDNSVVDTTSDSVGLIGQTNDYKEGNMNDLSINKHL